MKTHETIMIIKDEKDEKAVCHHLIQLLLLTLKIKILLKKLKLVIIRKELISI